jgi:hypothetical protein
MLVDSIEHLFNNTSIKSTFSHYVRLDFQLVVNYRTYGEGCNIMRKNFIWPTLDQKKIYMHIVIDLVEISHFD